MRRAPWPLMAPLQAEWQRLGGSRIQRDLFARLLAAAKAATARQSPTPCRAALERSVTRLDTHWRAAS
jgi:hypothetical protein